MPRGASGLRTTVLLVVLVSVAVLAPSPASADEYGYPGGTSPLRYPDSADHWECKHSSVPSGSLGDLDTATDLLDTQTVMTDYHAGACASSTDVVWIAVGWGDLDGSLGRTVCVSHVYWGVCDVFWVMFDQTSHFIIAQNVGGDIGANYNLNLNITYRHELGHSAGLHHVTGSLSPGPGAMNSAWVNPDVVSNWWAYLVYGDHHVSHIEEYLT